MTLARELVRRLLLGMLVVCWLAYLTGRDKIRFDAEVTLLRKDIAECTKERDAVREKARAVEEKAERAETMAAKMEGEMRGMERQVVDLRNEVKELRDRLYGPPGKANPSVTS